MQVKIYWINEIGSGRLGIIPRPRGGDWLEDEIQSLKQQGIDTIVSLLESEELRELEITAEQVICEANGISFLSFPIIDRGVPSSKPDALKLVQSLANILEEGKSVLIHYRQGVGRSALIAACVLVLGGISVDEVFEKIKKARGCSVPDTQEQRDWVARFAESVAPSNEC
jgi:protein-tyrosine phosphatase